MDNVWLVGTIVSAYITTLGVGFAAWVKRNGNGKGNGNLAQHIITCPHLTTLNGAIDKLGKDITEGLKEVRQEVAQQSARIDQLLQERR